MSTFKRILTEKNRKDYKRKGGEGGTSSTSNTPYNKAESKRKLTQSRLNRPTRVTPNPSGMTITNLAGGNIPDEQKFDQLERIAKQKTSKSVAAADDVSVQMRTQAADTAARAKETGPAQRRPLSNTTTGGEVKTYKLGDPGYPSKEAAKTLQRMTTADSTTTARLQANLRKDGVSQARSSKQQAAYRQQVKREADKLLSALRSKRDIAARMSRGIDDIERVKSLRSRAAQQVDLAKKTRARTAPGPQPSASQLTKFTTGQEKGYIGKSGAPTTKGIQTYTTRRATRGFGDAGYDAAKRGVKDPLGAAKSVDNIVSRAASGDKVARSEVKRTYKTMTSRYKDIVPSSQRTKVGLASLNKPVTAPPKVEAPTSTPAKPKVELPKTSSPSSGTGGSSTTTTLEKTKTKPAELKLGTPSAKKVELPKVKVTKSVNRPTDRLSGISPDVPSDVKKQMKSVGYDKPGTSTAADKKRIGDKIDKLTQSQQKKVTQRILQKAKPQLGARLTSKTVPNLAAKVNTQAATKTTLRGALGRGLAGAAGAAFDVVQGREDAKKSGASDRRAWLRGAARAAGGLIGGGLGAAAGAPSGFGSFALGTAGYMAGSQAADKLFTSLAGATQKQKDWLRQKNLATQAGTTAKDVKYRKGNQAIVFDKRVGKERIGTWDPKSQTYKAGVTNPVKAYTAKNPFERLGRQFSRSNEGSGLFGMGLVKGYGLADMAKRYYANKDEAERRKRVSDFKRTATR